MKNIVGLLVAAVALHPTAAACIAQDESHAPCEDGMGGSGAVTSGVGGDGGSGGATCIRSSRPRRLRRVHVADSRLLEANTLVLAESQGPQTLWLPDASSNAGAIIIVKEAGGAARRVTVLALDESGVDASAEYTDNAAKSSRTFVATSSDDCAHEWSLLDPAE